MENDDFLHSNRRNFCLQRHFCVLSLLNDSTGFSHYFKQKISSFSANFEIIQLN